MRQTLIGSFERRADAEAAAQALRDGGLAGERVQVTSAAAELSAGAADDGIAAHLRSFFAELFGPAAAPPFDSYAETVRGGGALVRVDVRDEPDLELARAALQGAGAVTIDERSDPEP